MISMTFEGVPLTHLTADHLMRIPNALLSGMLRFHVRHGGATNPELAEQRTMLTTEARRRGFNSPALQMLDPSPCACGGKGLYLVGVVTYCRKCRPGAVARLVQIERESREPRRAAAEQAFNDRERDNKRRDGGRAWHTSNRRQRGSR